MSLKLASDNHASAVTICRTRGSERIVFESNFLTVQEERELLAVVQALPFHEIQALRRYSETPRHAFWAALRCRATSTAIDLSVNRRRSKFVTVSHSSDDRIVLFHHPHPQGAQKTILGERLTFTAIRSFAVSYTVSITELSSKSVQNGTSR
jgi:hypothetical protein